MDRQTDGRTHAHTDNVKTVYPPQTKFAGGIKNFFHVPGVDENSSAITSPVSQQCGDYSGVSLLRKSLSPPIPVGGGAVDTND